MEWTALILGFTGSLHCLGMCSPLAISLTSMSSSALAYRVLYNSGRILTYGVLGSMVASVGLVGPFIKYQNLVSILLGFALVIAGVSRSPVHVPVITRVLGYVSNRVKKLFSMVLRNKTLFSTFLMGSLNGILPCGLSFLALTYCLTLSGPANGFLFMLLFGAGTLPVMLGFTGIFRWAVDRLHFKPAAITTGLLVFSGVFLIVRIFIVHIPQATSLKQGIVDIVLCR
ncbi:MAG: sulfite exporter TauE/SafE family protein [Bacteroidota bacterium]